MHGDRKLVTIDEDKNKRWLEEQKTFFMEATKAFLSKKKCQLITQAKKEEIINVIASWDSLGTDMRKGKYIWQKEFNFVKLGNNMPILFKKELNDNITDESGSIQVDQII